MTKKKNPKNAPAKVYEQDDQVRMINSTKRTVNGIKPNKPYMVQGDQVDKYRNHGFTIPGEVIEAIEDVVDTIPVGPTLEEMKDKVMSRGYEEAELEGKDLEEVTAIYNELKAENEPNLDDME
jgi:hypothetical protein